jgi:hypothetical protein
MPDDHAVHRWTSDAPRSLGGARALRGLTVAETQERATVLLNGVEPRAELG